MAVSQIERDLLSRCLDRKSRAWEDFVDRFLGLVLHVVRHTAQARSQRLSSEDYDDLAADVFLAIIANDFSVLRRFRGESSLATYLTIVARRVVVRKLAKRKSPARLSESAPAAEPASRDRPAEERISNREQVEQLLNGLNGSEAEVVRLYHLEGKSYQEISSRVGMPENSIGPTLSRARAKMRETSARSPT